jgi:ribulose-5-phosphate 4-epimerase/fuculose-1-phosphate aldolase
MKCGLVYLSQEACLVGDVSYHNYEGLVVEASEKVTLAKDLGPRNKVMLLRNHGAVCCGETVEEAFFYAYHLVLACDTQVYIIYHFELSNFEFIKMDLIWLVCNLRRNKPKVSDSKFA